MKDNDHSDLETRKVKALDEIVLWLKIIGTSALVLTVISSF